MKYGVLLVVSLIALLISGGNLIDGNIDAVTGITVLVSAITSVYSEYKLGWLKEDGHK